MPRNASQQFVKFQSNLPSFGDRKSSLEIERKSKIAWFAGNLDGQVNLLNPQVWLGLREPKLTPHYPNFAKVEVDKNNVTIEANPGYIGFLTKRETQYALGGYRFGGHIAAFEKENRVLESEVSEEYEFVFYPKGHCIKTGRTIYGDEVGKVTLHAKPHYLSAEQREKNPELPGIILNHTTTFVKPDGALLHKSEVNTSC